MGISKRKETNMTDSLCLIPSCEIMLDRTYTNISEYFLRNDRSVSYFLRTFGAEEKVIVGECSDFELLSAFLKICRQNSVEDYSVFKSFCRVVENLVGETDIFDATDLWIKTSETLIKEKNKLRATIASSELESIGVPILPNEDFDVHFARCGIVEAKPVLCPFGTNSVSMDTLWKAKNLQELEIKISQKLSASDSCAVFFEGFRFIEPNEYSAEKAYAKYRQEQSLNYNETDILKSQLLRITAKAAEELGKEIMIFLPDAPDVKSMGETAELLEYIDKCGIKCNTTIFAGDKVSLCMSRAMVGKGYKNITAATGFIGNGSIDGKRASLARTPARFLSK